MVLTIFTYYNLQYSLLAVHPVYILFNVHLVGMARLRPELSLLLTDEIVDKLKSFGVKTGIWLQLILIDQASISLFSTHSRRFCQRACSTAVQEGGAAMRGRAERASVLAVSVWRPSCISKGALGGRVDHQRCCNHYGVPLS